MILFFTKSLPFFDISLFQMFYFFCFWSVFGWFLEVIVRSVETGGFENRGFLNGAFCPIYGFGAIIMFIFLERLQNKPIILFIVSVIVLTAWEYIVGVLLEKIFKTKHLECINKLLSAHVLKNVNQEHQKYDCY